MDGEQRFGGPGRPPARSGGQGSPFPGGDPAATRAYPAAAGHPPAGQQYGGGQQYGAGQQYGGGPQYGAGQQYGGERGLFDPAGPGRYDPGEQGPDPFGQDGPGPGGSGGPSRRVVLISLGVAVLLAVVAGAGYALTRRDATPTAGPPTPSATLSTPSPAPTTPAASPTKTPTATPSTSATLAGTAPTGYVSQPWSTPGMDFGTVIGVKKQGAGAVVTVRRQQFLTGAAAEEYYANHPGEEPLDYKIVNLGKTRTFVVLPEALVYGQYLLGDQNQVATTQLTVPQFVAKAKQLQGKSPLLVWMYHRGTVNGPVGYLAEQYTP